MLFNKFIKKIARYVSGAIRYLFRGDFTGLLARRKALRIESSLQKIYNSNKNSTSITWIIVSPGHTSYIAHLVAERLNRYGFSVSITKHMPKHFDAEFYLVLCAQAYTTLPPAEKRISFQLEQSVSDRWFTKRYIDILNESLAVLEYSLINISFLEKKGIKYPYVHYMPLGAADFYGHEIEANASSIDVLFYGDNKSSPRRRRLLSALKKNFKVSIINDLFGDEMLQTIKSAKVVINLHYYENALLEAPRIYECLSLGVKIVSESSQDVDSYPDLQATVTFFEPGSIEEMIKAVQAALITPQTVTWVNPQSDNRFHFAFDRFLVSIGLLSPESFLDTPLKFRNQDNVQPCDTVALSMPETIKRRLAFEKIRPSNVGLFDGVRRSPSWVGCGLSYVALAKYAIKNDLETLTVMEDDVLLPFAYIQKLETIKNFLAEHAGQWDIFSGLLSVLHPDVRVMDVQESEGLVFVTIDRMTSMVFNIYSARGLQILDKWDFNDLNAKTNTIDRFIESHESLRVIVTLPFLVGHNEGLDSTLWGIKNSAYAAMISASQTTLYDKVAHFKATASEPAVICADASD